MPKTIEHFFSVTSPWTFMGLERLNEIAARHGATIVHKPVNLGAVFSVSGGLPLGQRSAQRQAYRLFELARWSKLLGIPLNAKPKHFPVTGWPAAGMITAAREQGLDCGKLTLAIMRAIWIEEKNVDDPDTLDAIASVAGFDGPALRAAADSEAIKAIFEAETKEAIERQVFGAPWYVYNGEPFWGQDRLEFLDRALANG